MGFHSTLNFIPDGAAWIQGAWGLMQSPGVGRASAPLGREPIWPESRNTYFRIHLEASNMAATMGLWHSH